jgi:hypothetical protein
MKPIEEVMIEMIETITEILCNPNVIPDDKFYELVTRSDGQIGFVIKPSKLYFQHVIDNCICVVTLFIYQVRKKKIPELKNIDPHKIVCALYRGQQKISNAGNLANLYPGNTDIPNDQSIVIPSSEITEFRKKLSKTQFEIAYRLGIIFSTFFTHIVTFMNLLVVVIPEKIACNNCGVCAECKIRHNKKTSFEDNVTPPSNPFVLLDLELSMLINIINGKEATDTDPVYFPSLYKVTNINQFRLWYNAAMTRAGRNEHASISQFSNVFHLMKSNTPKYDGSEPDNMLPLSEQCPSNLALADTPENPLFKISKGIPFHL